ncbi:hypothetical protein F2Q70_00003097 [Brassica cretica]|uniref:Uncharacterized protein n=2 Tax=Brassica cretica TaxID=69181 RepID=A0A8S9J287_BRACR|nr:hypothetical protein F2Q70_00003097 [Brassica cretica]
MPSTKRASKNTMALHSNHGSVHDDDEVIPKAEFMPHSFDSEEAEAYWVAMTAPPAESWYLSRPPLRRDLDLPSKSSYPFLDTVREFCQVPDEVEFLIPKLGEHVDNPLEGYFTC